MPEYTFKNIEGEVSLRYYRIADSPKYGETVLDDNGQEWTRIVDVPQQPAKVRDHRFVSRTLPRHDPSAPDHDEQGRPRFTSKKEVTEYVAKTESDWTYGEV
tara:strand:- start:438 stop:743 length:306 start_codon:yes stop_codon:yes gene_type:complete